MNTQHENSATPETEINKIEAKEIELRESPFCQKNCKVCGSPHRNQILEMLKDGVVYRDISKHLKKSYNENISISSISRHKKNYNRALRTLSLRVDLDKFDVQAENVAKHQKQVLFLMHESFNQIMSHLTAGSLVLSIDDFEKLTKLYYNVVRDPDSANDEDVIALFQQAAGKRGFDINQGVLFKPKKRDVE